MEELERTYLIKNLPEGLDTCRKKDVIDVYIPHSIAHPTLRIRKNGSTFEITKKVPQGDDKSIQKEYTIMLTELEFSELVKIEGKKVHKIRYYYDWNGVTAEIDVFQGALKGLILVDVEFKTVEEKDAFEMPDFCLVEVTQDDFIAGGMLCGKSYEDIEEDLKKYNYSRIE